MILGILVCSCTITKRHFGNGYHVEWNRKIKSGPEKNETLQTGCTENNTALKSIHEPDSLLLEGTSIADQTIPVSTVEPIKEREVQSAKQPQSVTKIKKDREIKNTVSDPEDEDEEPEEVKKQILHPLTYAIWGLWGIAIAFCIVLVAGNLYAILVIAACMFLAMILGIITIRTIRKNPEKYRLKAGSYIFSIFSIVIGGIATLVGLLILGAWDSF
ncbi:hypothetical protein D3C87_64510 [compost metagenome]